MKEPHTFLSRVPRFEPVAQAASAPPVPAPCAAPSGVRHSTGRHRHRSSSHSGASPRSTPTACRPAPDARRFTERSFRLVLEVVDRRRNVEQLRPLLTPSLVDVIRAYASADSPARRLGAATLVRVHLRAIEPHAVEAFGSYSRGQRIFVIAARVERASDTGWTITSLVLG
ncbi:Rv3235 family protein [Rhodococcus sp. NPDC049939]|uniref:Rv3235 family protein n=1 Tax=Rhodococcus sp. NPDC049939 TaxID=3155511 RepID=UPI0033C0FB7D